jgi:DMSO/TMAO reductase YedYZ molybdopterin-dependent catalytic subunit
MGDGQTRRFFLKASAVFGFVIALPFRAWGFFLTMLQVRTVEKGDFKFEPETGLLRWSGKIKGEPYQLVVDGLVEKPLSLSYADLSGLSQITQLSDFHCVEGWSVKDLRWGGIRFSEITKRVKPRPHARYAIFHALGTTESRPGGLDHYVESLPISHLLDPGRECLLALSLGGKPLTHQHGAPLRLISPYDLGYKGAKFLRRIEFSDKEQPGWWTLANPIYSSEAPVPEDRLRKRPRTKS